MRADPRVETASQALRGVFGDPAWLKKSALGVLVNLVPYAGAIWLMGYGLHYQRGVALGSGDRLPEWKHFEPQFKTGLYAFVVGLVYSLPLSIIITALAVVAVAGGMIGVAATEELAWFILVAVVLFVATMFLSALYGLVLWPVYAHVELHDTIASGFEFRAIYERVKVHRTVYWTAARRAVGLTLLSVTVMLLAMAIGFGGAAFIAFVVLPGELYGIASLIITPVQMVFGALGGLVSVPISFAVNRLWGQYASIAYGLGEQSTQATADEADSALPAPGTGAPQEG